MNRTPESRLPASKLPALYNAVMAACDTLDGIKDGIIGDPRKCRFDPSALLCREGDSPACLTAAQVTAVREIYQGATNPRTGKPLFPGWIRGSEAPPHGGGWAAYFVDKPEPARLDFWRSWVFGDPAWDPKSFDFDADALYADARLPYVSALDTDLSAFRKQGGKLLMYQGWADPVVPPEDTIEYFEAVQRTMGAAATGSFARLFMVPGMAHCMGGPGPDTFDALDALDRWVEKGGAPERIVAKHMTNGTPDRTRPLCSYPKQAVWNKRGSSDEEQNFVCSSAP